MLTTDAMIEDAFYNSIRNPRSAFRNRNMGGMGMGM